MGFAEDFLLRRHRCARSWRVLCGISLGNLAVDVDPSTPWDPWVSERRTLSGNPARNSVRMVIPYSWNALTSQAFPKRWLLAPARERFSSKLHNDFLCTLAR